MARLSYAKVSATVINSVNEAVSTAASATDNLFRYDPVSNQYSFNLSTKPMAEGKYVLYVNLDDGQSYTIQIGIRK